MAQQQADASRSAVLAQAQTAVASLRGLGDARPAAVAAARDLINLLRPRERGLEALADALLDAGALPLLVAAAQQSAQVSPDSDSATQAARLRACSHACKVVALLLMRAGEARAAAATAGAAPNASFDALADALRKHGAADAELAHCACHALFALFVHGKAPGHDAAVAGRAVAETLAEHGAVPYSALLVRLLLVDAPCWPAHRRQSATAAFFAAGGLEALLAAAGARREDDKALSLILGALAIALHVAPRERVAPLLAAGLLFDTLAWAMRRASLPPKTRTLSADLARVMAGEDAAAHACLASAGVLDAAVVCLQQRTLRCGDDGDDADFLCACANLLCAAASKNIVPGNVAAALTALARMTLALGCKARYGAGAIRQLCCVSGVADVALEIGLPTMLMTAVPTTCRDTPDVCYACDNSMLGLLAMAGSSTAAARATLRAGGARAAVRALQAHARCEVVVNTACTLIALLADACDASYGKELAVAINNAGGWRPLVAALRAHGSKIGLVVAGACAALLWATKVPECCSAAVEAGAIPAITAAMRAHVDDETLQECGIVLLRQLAAADAELAGSLIAARAAAAVIAAMERHGAAARLQYIGCCALTEFCYLCNRAPSDRSGVIAQRAASAAVAARAPAAVLAALRAHADSKELRMVAPRTLASLLLADEWSSDGAAWRDTRAALVALIAADDWPGEPDVAVLFRAAVSLVHAPVAVGAPGAPPPRTAVALCVALRSAAVLRATAISTAVVLANSELHPDQLTIFVGAAFGQLLTSMPGAASATFCADAVAAGAVQLLVAAAADISRAYVGPAQERWTLTNTALWALAELTARAPAAACRAAAYDVATLVGAFTHANAFAHMTAPTRRSVAAMMQRLQALIAAHEADDGNGCSVPDCELKLMSKRRCCLRRCPAAGDAALKRCGACRLASYCCAAHQREAWPQHKAACKARAAVQAACSQLLAQGAA